MGYWTFFLLLCVAANVIAYEANNIQDIFNDDAQFSFEANEKLSEESIKELLIQSTSKKSSLWPNLDTILFIAEKDMDFLVYERNDMNNPHLLKFNSNEAKKCLRKEWKTVIYIHGWRSKDNFIDKLKTAYMALDDQNINLIEVIWKKGSSNPTYFPSANRVSSVGKTVAKFIHFNCEHIDLNKLIIIGHSLGAHAAGYAGKFLQQEFKLTAPEIIGLDPAGIGFQGKKGKLQPEDARDVIVFHSSSSLGHFDPLGTVDIYINGGKEQPGLSSTQSHKFSKVFYKDLIGGMEALIGHRYSSFEDVKAGKIPNDDEIKLFHGEPFPPKGTLIYVGTQEQSQPKPELKSTKSKKCSVKMMKSFKRIFSLTANA